MSNPEWKNKVWDLMDAAERDTFKGKYAAAIKKYREALDLVPQPHAEMPDATALMHNMAEAYYLQQKYAEALPLWQQSLTYSGGDMVSIHLRMGQAYLETGDKANAQTELQYVFDRQGAAAFSGEGDQKYLDFLNSAS